MVRHQHLLCRRLQLLGSVDAGRVAVQVHAVLQDACLVPLQLVAVVHHLPEEQAVLVGPTGLLHDDRRCAPGDNLGLPPVYL